MGKITAATSLQEIAVLVSEALEKVGIPAVLSGGGAVTQYSENEYMTTDLDFNYGRTQQNHCACCRETRVFA